MFQWDWTVCSKPGHHAFPQEEVFTRSGGVYCDPLKTSTKNAHVNLLQLSQLSQLNSKFDTWNDNLHHLHLLTQVNDACRVPNTCLPQTLGCFGIPWVWEFGNVLLPPPPHESLIRGGEGRVTSPASSSHHGQTNNAPTHSQPVAGEF